MKTQKKVVFNTIVLYIKVVLNIILQLITVPIVINALGVSDYGVYTLIAGIVAMLSFLTNSLSVSTQRYISVAIGTNDINKIKQVFSNSFLVHLLLAILVVILLEFGSIFISNLNIASNRMYSAHLLYQILIITTLIRIITSPFSAITNAHEDMLIFSIISITDTLLMLITAILMQFINGDRLIFYGICIGLIAIVNFLCFYIWTRYKYRMYSINIRNIKQNYEKTLFKDIVSFSGWSLFGAIANVLKNQGVGVIVNLFKGSVANATYGIANQVNGAILNFSVMFQKALNPQLMQSEGMNNRKRLIEIALISSKFSVLALGIFAIPLILEIDEVLLIWLGSDIPLNTGRLIQLIVIYSIIYQYSSGLMSSIQAVGKICNYQIIMSIIIFLNLPLICLFFYLDFPIYYLAVAFIVLEIVSLVVRLYKAKKIVGIMIYDFLYKVISPTCIIILVSTLISLIPHLLLPQCFYRLILTTIVYVFAYLILSWFFAIDTNMRNKIASRVKSINVI